MGTKIGIALAAMLVIWASQATAQSIAPKDDTLAASQDVAAPASVLTEVAWRQAPRSRLRQSRNAGLGTGRYVPWSGSQAGIPANHDNDDNYQYWRQACCL